MVRKCSREDISVDKPARCVGKGLSRPNALYHNTVAVRVVMSYCYARRDIPSTAIIAETSSNSKPRGARRRPTPAATPAGWSPESAPPLEEGARDETPRITPHPRCLCQKLATTARAETRQSWSWGRWSRRWLPRLATRW